MDRAGLEVERGDGVDLAHQAVEPGGSDHGVCRQPDLVEPLHQVAERGALRAARRCAPSSAAWPRSRSARSVRTTTSSSSSSCSIAGDHVVRPQHVLVQQVAERQIVGVVADRHHGDDLLPVQEQGQRPLVDDRGLDRAALLVDAGDRLGQARVVRVGQQQRLAQGRARPFLCGVSPASGRLVAIRAQGAADAAGSDRLARQGPPPDPAAAAARPAPARCCGLAAGAAAWSAWPPGSCCSSSWRPKLPDTAELFAESEQAKVTVLAADGSADRRPRQQRGALRAAGRDLALAGRRR